MKREISQRMLQRFKLHSPALPHYNESATFDWIRCESGLPWLKLNTTVPYQTIVQEIENVKPFLTAHREDYNEHQGWHSFCLHGKSYDATREDTYYNDTRPYHWTAEACEFMPNTVEYFSNQWPGHQYQRVRIMLLEPGGYITVHSDYTQPQLNPINIAVTQPELCDFVMERHGRIPFEPGQCYWLDVSNRHVVFNRSNQPRWHIIIHQNFDNQQFKDLVVNSYKSLYNTNYENG